MKGEWEHGRTQASGSLCCCAGMFPEPQRGPGAAPVHKLVPLPMWLLVDLCWKVTALGLPKGTVLSLW